MRGLTPERIAEITGGRLSGNAALYSREISAVTTDSREVTEGCLFAAIEGEQTDGHNYIASAIAQGAVCVLCERLPEEQSAQKAAFITVASTEAALMEIAAFYRRQFDIPLIGVTGSAGKTTAKEMIACVLSRRLRTLKTQGNLNNELGVPLTLFRLEESHQYAVIEMGISEFGEMSRLSETARPTAAAFTLIGDSHLEFLGSREGVLRAKAEMLRYLPEDGVVYLNGDDELLRNLGTNLRTVSYGFGAHCDYRAAEAEYSKYGSRFKLLARNRELRIEVGQYGEHLVYAALLACAIGAEMGLADDELQAGVLDYAPVGGRSAIIDTALCTIINDCYNSNPSSLASALRSASHLEGRKVAILGDMLELGPQAEALHFQSGVYAAETGTDLVIACGALARHIAEGARSRRAQTLDYPDKGALMAELPGLITAGDLVLVKASRGMKFEDIVERLKLIAER